MCLRLNLWLMNEGKFIPPNREGREADIQRSVETTPKIHGVKEISFYFILFLKKYTNCLYYLNGPPIISGYKCTPDLHPTHHVTDDILVLIPVSFSLFQKRKKNCHIPFRYSNLKRDRHKETGKKELKYHQSSGSAFSGYFTCQTMYSNIQIQSNEILVHLSFHVCF